MGDRKMRAITAENINQLVRFANDQCIRKEDIVELLPVTNGYTLVYYG